MWLAILMLDFKRQNNGSDILKSRMYHNSAPYIASCNPHQTSTEGSLDMAIPSATLDEILLPQAIIIVWEGNLTGYAVIHLTLFSSSSPNRCFCPWCLFGCNPLEIIMPHSGLKGLQSGFAGVSHFCHSCVYPGNSTSIWLCEGHEESRTWLAILSFLGPFSPASTVHPVEPLARLIFGAWTVFLGLLLVFRIMHLVDIFSTQERRFGIIGTGHWGHTTAFWDGVLGLGAETDTCKNI